MCPKWKENHDHSLSSFQPDSNSDKAGETTLPLSSVQSSLDGRNKLGCIKLLYFKTYSIGNCTFVKRENFNDVNCEIVSCFYPHGYQRAS